MSVFRSGFSPEAFVSYLDRATTETRREAKKALYRGAKKILHGSVMMSPVDEHNLEDAHKLDVVRLNKDDMGIEISVGGVVRGEDVSAYAWIIHTGWSNSRGEVNKLGPLSEEKSRNNPAPYNGQVGPGYLDRSFDMHSGEIFAEVADTLLGD